MDGGEPITAVLTASWSSAATGKKKREKAMAIDGSNGRPAGHAGWGTNPIELTGQPGQAHPYDSGASSRPLHAGRGFTRLAGRGGPARQPRLHAVG